MSQYVGINCGAKLKTARAELLGESSTLSLCIVLKKYQQKNADQVKFLICKKKLNFLTTMKELCPQRLILVSNKTMRL